MKRIDLPDAVRLILDTLHGAGYMAYAVGGCVRDSLLGREPHDWDICTSATPEQTKTCFGDYRTIDTGIQHGTVTVMVEHTPYEVTTFRKDGNYSNSRHPDKVTFVSDLKEDLARRDFTINAMAYNEEKGLVDPFGGQDDLAAQMLRCVGNPTERFDEDALRILRALRFAATYGLWVHPTTKDAIHQKKNDLHRIAVERIQTEMTKLICAESALPIMLGFKDVVATVIHEMKVFGLCVCILSCS